MGQAASRPAKAAEEVHSTANDLASDTNTTNGPTTPIQHPPRSSSLNITAPSPPRRLTRFSAILDPYDLSYSSSPTAAAAPKDAFQPKDYRGSANTASTADTYFTSKMNSDEETANCTPASRSSSPSAAAARYGTYYRSITGSDDEITGSDDEITPAPRMTAVYAPCGPVTPGPEDEAQDGEEHGGRDMGRSACLVQSPSGNMLLERREYLNHPERPLTLKERQDLIRMNVFNEYVEATAQERIVADRVMEASGVSAEERAKKLKLIGDELKMITDGAKKTKKGKRGCWGGFKACFGM